jgi:hypothetical protein
MTETRATAGTTSADQDDEALERPATSEAETSVGSSADDDAAGDGRTVGWTSATGDSTGTAPRYTRAPGMTPPPDNPAAVPAQSATGISGLAPGVGGGAAVSGSSVGKASVVTSGSAPVSAPPTSGGPYSGSAAPTSGVPVSGMPVSGMPVSGIPGGPTIARASVRATSPTMGRTTNLATDHTRPVSVTGSARVTEAVRSARATVAAAAGRSPRRARLHIKRIDPWSVMKFSFAVSFVLFVMVIVATAVLYLGLDKMEVFKSINKALAEMVGAAGTSAGSSFKITAKGVIGGAALIGLVNVVLFTALATLGAFIYNVCADLVGGIELTLAERD